MNYFLLTIVTCLLLAIQQINHVVTADEECCDEYCYGTDRERPQTRQYSTKTAYEVVRGSDYGKNYQVFNCQPTKMWFISRHGTRNPTSKEIAAMQELEALRNEIIANYEQRKYGPTTGGLCMADKAMLKMWKLNKNITDTYANMLTFQGWQDLKFLAKSYQKIFENILDKQYDPTKFLFRHTNSQRTEASFKAFAEGLFGDNAGDRIMLPQPPVVDNLLKTYDNCPEWQQRNDMKFGPDTEVYKFEHSQIMNKTLFDISRRLGFKYILEREQIDTIWDMCRYEQAWHIDRSSAWCSAFTPNLVSVLEYAEDLKYYYKTGYGSELNSKISCSAMQDMLKHLNNTNQPQVVAYFAHSAAIQLLATALGIQKDREPLRADNYMQMKNRLWKTSLLSPFAANLAVVKYSCINDPRGSDAKLMFFINQSPVHLDWCNVGLCNWEDVMTNYEKFLNIDCNQHFCNNHNHSVNNQLSLSLMLSSVIILIIISFTNRNSI